MLPGYAADTAGYNFKRRTVPPVDFVRCGLGGKIRLQLVDLPILQNVFGSHFRLHARSCGMYRFKPWPPRVAKRNDLRHRLGLSATASG